VYGSCTLSLLKGCFFLNLIVNFFVLNCFSTDECDKDIAKYDTTVEFLKPLFTMGQAAGKNSSLKETHILNMKQKEIM
jgi:hypothetical protein